MQKKKHKENSKTLITSFNFSECVSRTKTKSRTIQDFQSRTSGHPVQSYLVQHWRKKIEKKEGV